MTKKYTEREVNDIVNQAVNQALEEQMKEIEKENRLKEIEDTVFDLMKRVSTLEEAHKNDTERIGFGGKK